jgi:lysophospholipase L1-like esterase
MSLKLATGLGTIAALLLSVMAPAATAVAAHNSNNPLWPGAKPATSGRYVALGDSVAAGDGLPINPAYPYGQCRQSTSGYPNLVAKQIGLPLTNLTCSGATVGDLVTAQGVDGPNIPAQLPRAFAGGVPEVVTLTAGANDVQWNQFIYACYQYDCTQDRYDLAARGLLALYREKLDYALNSIDRRSGNAQPQVIVTGYYNPLSRACSAQEPKLTRAEISWLTRQYNALNKIIRSEAREHDATFVSLNFRGHDICSKNSWVQGLEAKAPLHPTAEGQAYIAKRVAAAIDR